MLGCSESATTNVASASAPIAPRIQLSSFTIELPRLAAGLPKPAPRAETFRRGLVLGPLEAPEDEEAFKRQHRQLLDRAVALGVTDL